MLKFVDQSGGQVSKGDQDVGRDALVGSVEAEEGSVLSGIDLSHRNEDQKKIR